MRLLQLEAALALPSTTSLHSVGSEVTQRQGWGERRTLTYLGVSRELWWGLPPQDSDNVEDAVSCWVVGLVDGECLLGQVFVFVGVFLLRNETAGSDATCQPPGMTLSHLHTFAGAVSPHLWLLGPQSPLLTMKRLKVTVISCPASVHHLRVCCWVPKSSRICCPAMMCCLHSCWA